MSTGTRVSKDANLDYLAVSKNMILPQITLGVTPAGPAGSLGYSVSDGEVYYSNGTVWVPIRGPRLRLNLTQSLSRPCDFLGQPKFSDDSTQLFIGYVNNPPNQLIDIFSLNQTTGQVTLTKQLPVDPLWPNVWDGDVTGDFTLCSVVDALYDPGVPDNARIRILDTNFNVLATRTFSTGPAVQGGLIFGGHFTSDKKYVTFSYSNYDPDPMNVTTIQYILNVSDLSTYAVATLPGFDINSPIPFTLNGSMYLSYQQTNGAPYSPVLATPPYYSSVYLIASGTLTLVDQKLLPRFSEKDVVVYADGARIAHGGFCSLFPDQVSPYESNEGELTSLPDDNAEARVFNFDGTSLQLVIKQSVNCCNRTTIWPPGDGKIFLLGQNTIISPPPAPRTIDREFYGLVSLSGAPGSLEFVPITLPQQDVTHNIPAFSSDGRWLARVGSTTSNGINNIQILHITGF